MMLSEKGINSKNNGYDPSFFEVDDIQNAKSIILTAEPGTSTEERWIKETPYLIEQVEYFLKPNENTCILDYGCGIGRVSKGIIHAFNCSVVGVDISSSMRKLALDYVNSDKFSILSPEELDRKVEAGFCADHSISIWVLQHCENPIRDIFRIKSVLKRNGLFLVVNNIRRVLPTSNGWVNDRIDINALLNRHFNSLHISTLPDSVSIPNIIQHTFIGVLQNF